MEVSASMEAHCIFQMRSYRSLRHLIAWVPCVMMTAALAASLQAAPAVQYETRNFTVNGAPSPHMAKDFCETAERCRHDMAVLWLGKPMPDWSAKCPIKVTVGDDLGAGGATTFVFQGSEVFDWEMDIQGSAKRILDSVLPHEITHMVLASYFRQPVPRWLDEGAATSVEHVSEKDNYRNMLRHFLREDVKKCLPFRRMVSLKEYPPDPMPFYAQGFSVVEYLLALGDQLHGDGHRRLVGFAEIGMKSGDWDLALRECYDIDNLGQLQRDRWIVWVEAGSPKGREILNLQSNANSSMIAAMENLPEEPLPLRPLNLPAHAPIALVSARPSPPYGKSVYENPIGNPVTAIPAQTDDGSKVVPIPVDLDKRPANGWVAVESKPNAPVLIDVMRQPVYR